MSRLVVFALGVIFGAAALYWLAPRIASDAEPAPAVTVPVASSPPAPVSLPVPTEPPFQEPIPPPTDAPPTAASAPEVADVATTLPSPIAADGATSSVAPDPVGPLAPPLVDLPPAAAPAPTSESQSSAPQSSAEATVSSQAAPPATPASAAPDAKALTEPLADVTGIPAKLLIPVEGAKAETLIDTFTQARGGGSRPHDAIDIMAPSGTPVRAVDDGKIVKLFLSDAGGITAYQFDPTEKFAYYYAHLERYADRLAEGQVVKRGDVIGYVGYTGNANPAAPHLHFAIVVLGPEKRWWEGTPINPYPVLIGATGSASAVASD
ncbi:MAG TPA: M23 family metallopeptidase [Candidatus Saccharimonadia bacterium]|nr:M23 family metallopeptidase [Candidatus Saccharimonadia bacterium]